MFTPAIPAGFASLFGGPSLDSGTPPIAEDRRLPPAPPANSRLGLWDAGNRHKTLLAIGTGLLSGSSFQDGLSRAGSNVLGLSDKLKADGRRQVAYGGLGDSFEITEDPETGQRTVLAVPEFQEYNEKKRTKSKDVADMNGRVMFALQQLPEEQRAAAYATIRANPQYYGVDPATMPETYDPNYAAMTAGMGMTVSQALTRQRADGNAEAMQDYRRDVQADRTRRTDIYERRSDALTSQGQQRIGQAQQRIAAGGRKGPGGSQGGDNSQYEYRIGPNGVMQRRLKR